MDPSKGRDTFKRETKFIYPILYWGCLYMSRSAAAERDVVRNLPTKFSDANKCKCGSINKLRILDFAYLRFKIKVHR